MEHGGNYAAPLVLIVGCEALSLLQGNAPDTVFVQLLTKHELDRLVAEDARLLRNGLAHSFETKFIQVGARRIELVVSWGKREHLARGNGPLRLFLNVLTLWDDLTQELAAFEDRLKRDPGWADRAPDGWAKRPARRARAGGASVQSEGTRCLGGSLQSLTRPTLPSQQPAQAMPAQNQPGPVSAPGHVHTNS